MRLRKEVVILLMPFWLGATNAVTSHNSSCLAKSQNETIDGWPCQFPFTLENKTYHSCTWDYSQFSDNKPWCSVKTDENGNHIPDYFGICPEDKGCPIQSRRCGIPFREHHRLNDSNFEPDNGMLPWMVSLGKFASINKWQHECGGSLVTNKHVLTAAHCFDNVMRVGLDGYSMWLGETDLSLPFHYGTIRRVIQTLRHPKYEDGKPYFDVGIAVADQIIEFSNFIRPICLPMRPIDDIDFRVGAQVTLAGWGTFYNNENSLNKGDILKLFSLKIISKEACEKIFSKEQLGIDGIPEFRILQQLSDGITPDLACVGAPFKRTEGACEGDSGSPVILAVDGTSNGDNYFEQHFVVSTGLDCRKEATIYVRISERRILSWIQKVTETSPLLLVVGGYSNLVPEDMPKILSDIEVLSPDPNSQCTGFPDPIELENGHLLRVLGATGQFAKNGATVCGGVTEEKVINNCFEYQPILNKWKEISPIKIGRFETASVVDSSDNIWIIGGSNGTTGIGFTEVYQFNPKGNSTWIQGPDLPSELRDSGLQSHCAVRLNRTHVFLASGLAEGFRIRNTLKWKKHKLQKKKEGDRKKLGGASPRRGDYDEEILRKSSAEKDESFEMTSDEYYEDYEYENFDKISGGLRYPFAWMFDGNQWDPIADMLGPRDRPACSVVQMPDGKIRILVAGGCREWCEETPGIVDAEMYDPETNTWTKVADLPYGINSASMEMFDGYPTLVGGYINEINGENSNLLQYHPESDEWVQHKTTMRIARSSPTVFQVPRWLFSC